MSDTTGTRSVGSSNPSICGTSTPTAIAIVDSTTNATPVFMDRKYAFTAERWIHKKPATEPRNPSSTSSRAPKP